MSGVRRKRGVSLEPTRAFRGVDCEILCGACHHVIASRHRNLVVFLGPRPPGVEKLPATVDCPFCRVPNLLDPKRLNVSEQQTEMRLPHLGGGPAIGLHIF